MEQIFEDGFERERAQADASSESRSVTLDSIDGPSDLRRLRVDQLLPLADEIRQFLVQFAAEQGGHFASNMGVVELTLALHYTFDTPQDLIVWDVGHQAYVHKILTGRRERFSTLRQYQGLSGFLKRDESPFDSFGAGHASTAPSAAFGMAVGRDLKGGQEKVVAVIGDGAMTGGLAFEALNNAGASGRDLLVVLNDNYMSISPNVGAMHQYLTTLTTHPYYLRMKKDIATVLGRFRRVGPPTAELARRMGSGLKGALTPGALFEALGFTYIGPVDGHDLPSLIDILQKIKDQFRGPVLLHVLTHKGKGYAPAEADPVKWHGVTPFDPETGTIFTKPKTGVECPNYTNAFGDVLVDLARRKTDVVAITAAMAPGTGLTKFQETFPERFFDVGIAEGHAVTFAAGLATQGIRPVCAIYSSFLQRAFDHVFHDVALQHLPVIFALDRGGLVGADGPTHHGCYDLSFMRLIPEVVLAAPRDADELADLLETAYAYTAGPFAIRYPRDNSPVPRTREPRILPIGSWELLEPATGEKPVYLLAVGAMIGLARDVARGLRLLGHDVALVNARFIKPVDLDFLRRIAASSALIATLEEGTLRGGFGSGVHEASVEEDLRLSGRLLHFGLPDRFVAHGSRNELLGEIELTAEKVVERILARLHEG